MIRDRILVGCKSDYIRERLLENSDLKLKRAIEIARSHEASKHQLQEMQKESAEMSVDRVSQKSGKKTPKDDSKTGDSQMNKDECGRCGRRRHRNFKDCPARNSKCDKYQGLGHWKKKV